MDDFFYCHGYSPFLAIVKQTPMWSFCFFIGYLTLAGLFYNNGCMPLIDKTSKSPRLIVEGVEYINRDTRIYTNGFISPGLIFYIGRPINSVYDINKMEGSKGNILLIVQDRLAAPMGKEMERSFVPVKHTQYQGRKYTVYSRKDD